MMVIAAAGMLTSLISVVSLASGPAASQQQTPVVRPSAAAKDLTPPRTPWGEPDLQGTWDTNTSVLLERPAEFAGKEFLTDEEVLRRSQKHSALLSGAYNDYWLDKLRDSNRTSLIVDPPDGKLPPLTPEAQERAKAWRRTDSPASWEDLDPYTRCISRGMPGTMLPGFYSHFYQILQSPGYVVLLIELLHDIRIIPVGDRPHIASSIRQWLGDPRGRWEGNTLVVETTNFNDKINNDRGITVFGAGGDLHLVERFKRVDANTIDYQLTVDAPKTFTKPWTAAVPMRKTNDLIYEYACHEGNYAMRNSLSGARAQDALSENDRRSQQKAAEKAFARD
jgi:hypothetical protein